MLVGRCFIVCKLDVDEDKDPEARSNEDEKDPELSRHRHRRGRRGRFPRGTQQIVCLWRSQSSALEEGWFYHSHQSILIESFSSKHSHQSIGNLPQIKC